MGELYSFSGSAARAVREGTERGNAPAEQPVQNSNRYCVYSQTRERFVAVDVEAVDGESGDLDAAFRTLNSGDGSARWIVPFGNISPGSVRFPLDLIFLTKNCVVLSIVSSFPMTRIGTSSAHAWSALAVPADALERDAILPGDKLIICSPEEMKQKLQPLQEAAANTQEAAQPAAPVDDAAKNETQTGAAQDVSAQGAAESGESGSNKVTPQEHHAEPPAKDENLPTAAEKPWEKTGAKRGWFKRLVLGDTPDPRRAKRESIPGLVAYYFTGGTPVPHAVRDISSSGVYILTKERWYKGTVVRLTLTDRHKPTVERSITVNARAVRFGSDGVGFEYVLEGDSSSSGLQDVTGQTNGVDIAQVEDFLQNLKAP
jgi:hypothetical protein